MKNKLLSIFALLLISVVSARAIDFTLKVNQEELAVVSATGATIVQIPQGTVGKQVKVGASEFLLSFGKDVRNNLSAILSPVLDRNTPLSFSTLDKEVKTDGNAIVSVRYSNALSTAEIDPGFLGRVTVSDLKGYSPATLTPASLMSDAKPISKTNKETETPKISTSPSVTSTPSTVSNNISSDPLPQKDSLRSQEEGKGIFTVLKEEGIKGLFDSKNMVSGLERSKKSKLVSVNQPDLKKSIPVGVMKVIPPEQFAKAANDKTGEIRLLGLKGSVLVDGKPVTDGAMVSQKSVISTNGSSSVVAVIGGIHLVTVHEKSSVAITQELKEKQMMTLVELKSGNIFADVNHRKGMTQDFKIKTAKGAVSATGSKALIATMPDGTLVTIVFESKWKGTDANGNPVLDSSPTNAPADMGIKFVSFGSVPAMDGAKLQDIVNKMADFINNSVVQNSPGNFSFVQDPVLSYSSGNASTLPDGSTNPGSTVEGKMQKLLLAITDVVVTDEKDGGTSLSVGGSNDPTQFSGSNTLNSNGGANVSLIRLQPFETTPGGL